MWMNNDCPLLRLALKETEKQSFVENVALHIERTEERRLQKEKELKRVKRTGARLTDYRFSLCR